MVDLAVLEAAGYIDLIGREGASTGDGINFTQTWHISYLAHMTSVYYFSSKSGCCDAAHTPSVEPLEQLGHGTSGAAGYPDPGPASAPAASNTLLPSLCVNNARLCGLLAVHSLHAS